MSEPPLDAPRSRHDRVKQVFMAALDVPRGRRAAFLSVTCGGDESLQREVLELFLLHGESDSVLDAPLDGAEALAGLAVPGEGRVGPYVLVRELGRGGMGVVYLGERAGQLAAVKLLAAGAVSPEVRERFRLEAEILGRLNHAGIARVLDSGDMAGPGGVPQPWIAMEYVEGRPLRDYAEAAGLSVESRLALLAAVCDAVQHAHSHGIVHRDLKPSNILVRSDGQPVVLDFGVARLVAGDERPTELVTRTGQLLGTPQYMSPEQVQAEPARIGPPSDVYSLGILAYELLCGRPPYEASSVSLHRAIVSILTLEPPPLGDVVPAFRGSLEHIVGMALEKDPALRYPDAGALADDLRRRIEGRSVRARGPDLARRILSWSRRRRRLVAVGLSVALATLVFSAWVLGTGRAVPHERVLATYRNAETLVIGAVPLIYEGERTADRLREAIGMLTQARSLLDGVPALRHRSMLLRSLEKDLGTAQFLLGELTWDTTPYRASLLTLEHAMSIPEAPAPGWRREIQVQELGSLQVPQADLIGLSAGAALGLHRLWGEASTIESAQALAQGMRLETLRRFGRPRAGPGAPDEAMLQFTYCYNALAEITTDAARFYWDPARAQRAVLYSDSAMARKAAFEANWPALGSLLYVRGRAFRTLAELTGAPGARDSASAYLRACADYRGPNRPWVFAQTREEMALLGLGWARQTSDPGQCLERLRHSRRDVDTAMTVLASARFPIAASASMRSLGSEILVELSRATRQPAWLDSSEAQLALATLAFPVTSLPRHASEGWVRTALIARARYELLGEAGRLDSALEALDRARGIAEGRRDSFVLDRVALERRVVLELRNSRRVR